MQNRQTDDTLHHYKKNFTLLKEIFPHIASIITPTTPSTITQIPTKNNSVSISYKETLLHSKYNPEKEGTTFSKLHNISFGDTVFLYGFGLGYHILPLLQTIGPKGHLYVIELNADILSTACQLMDLSAVFTSNNFHLLASIDEMDIANQINTLIDDLNTIPPHQKKLIIHNPSFKCIPKPFSKIKNALELLILGNETKFVFKDIMKENLKENLDIIVKNPGIQTFFGLLKNTPTLFIGAGPSLDKAIPYLKKMQSRAFYCCVDTAFPILVKFGITPDIIITVDPQPESIRHFKGHLQTKQQPILIFTPTACAHIVTKYNGPKLVVMKKDQALLKDVEMDLIKKGATIGGGSVSCIGFDILIQLKANPIILFGMDFAYPHLKAYSSNTASSSLFLNRVNKFNSLEMQHLKFISKKKIVPLKNKTGTDIPSHQNLHSYVKNMEQIVRLNPSSNYLNFLSEGVNIKGIENIYFEEELERHLNREVIKKFPEIKELPDNHKLKEKIISKILS